MHDYLAGEWIRAEDASYVPRSRVNYADGVCVAACAEEAQAQALAAGQESAVVVSFADMIAIADAGEMEAGSMHQHNPDHDHAADMADEDHMPGMEMDHAMESDKC